MGFSFLEEFSVFTLNCEENYNGGTSIWNFLGVYSLVHVGLLRRGDRCCVFGVLPCRRDWGDLWW
jgi:hypothetical protein